MYPFFDRGPFAGAPTETGSLLFISSPAYDYPVAANMVPSEIAFQHHTGAPSGLRFRAQSSADLLNAAPKTPTDPPAVAAIDVERDTPVLQTTYLLTHHILHASVLVCSCVPFSWCGHDPCNASGVSPFFGGF